MSELAERFVTAFERLVECECMPELQFGQSSVAETIGSVPASTSGTVIAGHVDPNTTGAWVEVSAATAFTAQFALVQFGAVDGDTLVDLGIGASGSEVVIVENLYARGKAINSNFSSYSFPILIPAGSRVSARMQSSSGATSVQVVITLFPATLVGMCAPSHIYAYGVDTTQSRGTNIDPGATANTDSGWVELSAATSRQHTYMMTSGRYGDNVIAAATNWLVDIGVGGAGAEQAIVNDLFITAESTTDQPRNTVREFPMFVPSGSRLSARARSSVATDTDRDVYLIVYGA